MHRVQTYKIICQGCELVIDVPNRRSDRQRHQQTTPAHTVKCPHPTAWRHINVELSARLRVVTQHKSPAESSTQMVYQCTLPLSTKTLTLVAGTIRAHRARVKSRWRKLPDHHAALLVLAVLRHDQRPHDLATANGISHSTLRRWVLQVITTLAARAPRLDRVLRRAKRNKLHTLLLDGTLIRTHRPHRRTGRRNRRAHYSGKHRTFGLLVLGLTDPAGNLLWLSAAVPARTSEITHARRQHLTDRLRHHHLAVFTDLGFTTLDDQPHTHPTVITGTRPNRYHPLTTAQQQANQLIASERATNEHAFSNLKHWRILDRLRGTYRNHATTLLRALLTLTATHTTRHTIR